MYSCDWSPLSLTSPGQDQTIVTPTLSWLSVKWRSDVSVRVDSAVAARGFFKASGSIVRWLSAQGERIGSRAAEHRLDEPARLSLGMVASRRARLHFPWQVHCSSAAPCCSQLPVWPVTRELNQCRSFETANRSVVQRGTAMSRRGRPSAARRTNWWESREHEVGCGHARRSVRSRSTQGRFAMAAQPELDAPFV